MPGFVSLGLEVEVMGQRMFSALFYGRKDNMHPELSPSFFRNSEGGPLDYYVHALSSVSRPSDLKGLKSSLHTLRLALIKRWMQLIRDLFEDGGGNFFVVFID